ncbi:MAG: thioesterase, partial [Demequinaceae bacterium]|nr:thioesterase [Demequinaceae bacterium]
MSKHLAIKDLARIDSMMRAGWWDRFRRQGWYPAVAGRMITYRKSLTIGQRFEVESRLLGMDDRWLYVQPAFRAEGHAYAHAMVRTRCLKKSGGSVEHDEMGEFLGGFPDSLAAPARVGPWTAATKDPVWRSRAGNRAQRIGAQGIGRRESGRCLGGCGTQEVTLTAERRG